MYIRTARVPLEILAERSIIRNVHRHIWLLRLYNNRSHAYNNDADDDSQKQNRHRIHRLEKIVHFGWLRGYTGDWLIAHRPIVFRLGPAASELGFVSREERKIVRHSYLQNHSRFYLEL